MFNTQTKLSKEEMNHRMENTKLTPDQLEEEKELVHNINSLAKLIQSSKLQFCVSLAQLFSWVDRVYGYGMREKYWNHHYLNGTFNLQYNTARRYATIGKNEKLILQRSKGRIDIKDTYECLRRLMDEHGDEEFVTDEILKLVEKSKKEKKENKSNANNTDPSNHTGPSNHTDPANNTGPSNHTDPANNTDPTNKKNDMNHRTHIVDVKVSGNHIVPIPKISEPDDSDYEMEDTNSNAKLLEENKMLKQNIQGLTLTIQKLKWIIVSQEREIEELKLILALKTGTNIGIGKK